MSRVITFSRVFPSYHPKAGEPTYFVEKIIGGLVHLDKPGCDTELIKGLRDCGWLKIGNMSDNYKYHTVRAGHRWKVGDKFSPRVWSDKPYRSKQITIASDIEIKKIWDVEFDEDGCLWVYGLIEGDHLNKVAKNDGLTTRDLLDWFNKPFTGQIICWNEKIKY